MTANAELLTTISPPPSAAALAPGADGAHDERGAACQRLYLAQSAPAPLVDAVHECLAARLREVAAIDPKRRPALEALEYAYASLRTASAVPVPDVSRHHRVTPWSLLHLAPDAPSDVVEAAYSFWLTCRAKAARRSRLRPSSLSLPRLFARLLPRRRQRAPRRVKIATPVPARSTVNSRTTRAVCAQPSVQARAYLVAEAGARTEPLAIGETPLRIGSEAQFDVVVPVGTAAATPIEARIWTRDGRCLLHAGAETGGVLVNGEALNWAVLDDGDRIRVGEAVFRFQATPTPLG